MVLLFADASTVDARAAGGDAALGLSMFRNRVVPARVRRVLNVESGLNSCGARARGWTTVESEEVGVLALAGLTYTAALAGGAKGFVAAVAGGLALGPSRGGRCASGPARPTTSGRCWPC